MRNSFIQTNSPVNKKYWNACLSVLFFTIRNFVFHSILFFYKQKKILLRIFIMFVMMENVIVSQMYQLTHCLGKHKKYIGSNVTPSLATGNVWVKIFEDNFDGNTLKLDNWWVKTTSYCINKEIQCNKVENVQIHNGALHLIAKKQNSYCTSPCDTVPSLRHYTSGQIRSRWLFYHGKIESRIKIPKEKGLWPAFWTVGGSENRGDYSEIDIFEFYGTDPKLARWLHTNLYHSYVVGTKDDCPKVKKYSKKEEFSQSFSFFSVEWLPDQLIWTVRGKKIRKVKEHIVIPLPFPLNFLFATHFVLKAFPRTPMMIVHSLAVDSGVDASTLFPSEMLVDWVRYYRRMWCSDIRDLTILKCKDKYFPIKPKLFNNIVGKTIRIEGRPSVNCIYEVPVNHRLDLIAHESITIGQGFHAKEGSYFNARIQSLPCTAYRVYDSTALIDYKNTKSLDKENLLPQKETLENIPYIYPNPSEGIFNINFGKVDYKYYSVKVINTLGNIVYYSEEIKNDKMRINLTSFPDGIYAVSLFNRHTHKQIIYKIIKQ